MKTSDRHAGRTGGIALYLIFLVAGAIIGAIAGGEIIRNLYRRQSPQPVITGQDSVTDNSSARVVVQDKLHRSRRNAIVRATELVAPSVVGVVVTQLQYVGSTYYLQDFFNPFMHPKMVPQYKEVQNMGSGFVIDESGLVLTNYHVVDGARKLFVDLPDGRQFEGTVVGMDPATDVAVISVDCKDKLVAAPLGNSDDIMIGEWAIAIGNPFLNFFNDAKPTVTVGVISAVDRNFAPSDEVHYQNMIQTDAAINPGNSGGPLLNAQGEVIAINTFIYTGSSHNRGSIGIGFAIPINRAKRVKDELVTYGRKRPVWTGIAVQDIDRSIALALGYDKTTGVVVTNVQKNGPGDIAGIRDGDIITQIGDRIIRNHFDIEGVFLNYFVGDSLPITIIRRGKQYSVTLVLKEYRKG